MGKPFERLICYVSKLNLKFYQVEIFDFDLNLLVELCIVLELQSQKD